MIGTFFNTVFNYPIFNALIWLYNTVAFHNFGLAVIELTVLIKAVLWPLSAKALRSQKALQEIQPKMDALKKQYPNKDQQEELGRAMMALYSQEKVSPFSSCLPLLIQLPVFIGLYHAMSQGLSSSGFDHLYSFVAKPETVNTSFLWIFDLGKKPSAAPVGMLLALAAGATQYVQAKMMITRQQPKQVPGAQDEQMLATVNTQMLYMMPALTIFLGWTLPAGLSLYWLMQNVITVAQQRAYFGSVRSALSAPTKPAAPAAKS